MPTRSTSGPMTAPRRNRMADEMAACQYNPFDEIERAMFILWDKVKNDRLRLIAYRAMVKAFEFFKMMTKKQDFHESEQ